MKAMGICAMMVLVSTTCLADVDPYWSVVSWPGTGTINVYARPDGEGPLLEDLQRTISVNIVDNTPNHAPIVGFPAEKIRLVVRLFAYGCNAGTTKVVISAADHDTELWGSTQLNGPFVFCRNYSSLDYDLNNSYFAVEVKTNSGNWVAISSGDDWFSFRFDVRTPDLNGDGTVNITDSTIFAQRRAGGVYDRTVDLDFDNQMLLGDVSLMSAAFFQEAHCQ